MDVRVDGLTIFVKEFGIEVTETFISPILQKRNIIFWNAALFVLDSLRTKSDKLMWIFRKIYFIFARSWKTAGFSRLMSFSKKSHFIARFCKASFVFFDWVATFRCKPCADAVQAKVDLLREQRQALGNVNKGEDSEPVTDLELSRSAGLVYDEGARTLTTPTHGTFCMFAPIRVKIQVCVTDCVTMCCR
jgi:hypothetical protein